MTRLWAQGTPITVKAGASGAPVVFRWRGETYPVETVLARWRVADAWWDEGALWREYFRVTTTNGLLAVIFHDLVEHTWRLERVYD